MRWATVMLTTVLLLGSACVPSAECAWVLWSKESFHSLVGTFSQSPWEIEEAFEQLKDCQRRQAQLWEEKAAQYEKHPDLEKMKKTPYKGVTVWLKESAMSGQFTRPAHVISWNFICLPDTIDPRKKKD